MSDNNRVSIDADRVKKAREFQKNLEIVAVRGLDIPEKWVDDDYTCYDICDIMKKQNEIIDCLKQIERIL